MINCCPTLPMIPFPLSEGCLNTVRLVGACLLISTHIILPTQTCPTWGHTTARVHSRSVRLVNDLPVPDRPVRLLRRVRCFFVTRPPARLTFAEGIPARVPYRTCRRRFTYSPLAIQAGHDSGAACIPGDTAHLTSLPADTSTTFAETLAPSGSFRAVLRQELAEHSEERPLEPASIFFGGGVDGYRPAPACSRV